MADIIEIRVVENKKDQKKFIELPWEIYQGDPNWIPPLLSDMYSTLNPRKNALLRLGPSCFFLAYENGQPVGRIGAGMDLKLNEAKKENMGYITLFESIEKYPVAEALFSAAMQWLKSRGAVYASGPQSPSNGDDYRGLLIEGFDSPPVLLNSYNPPYYMSFFEKYGFYKQFDRFAYYYDLTEEPPPRLARGVMLAEKRFAFHVRPINLRNMEQEMQVIKKVVEEAMPDWPDMIPPGDEEIAAEADKLKQLAVSELILFVENSENQCLGFAVTLPDYNQVLAHLNGRLFPLGFLKYLWYRRRIKGVRMFVLFVTPKGRRRGVSAALYHHTMQNARRLGYRFGEGSTIHEFNLRMNVDARKAGGKLYKKYRVYRYDL